jgi:hypothetical protein
MIMSEISFRGKVAAEGVSLASRAAVAVPLLGRLTVGSAEGHGVVVPYYRSDTLASEVPYWEHFAADPTSGRLPRSQKEVALLTVSEEHIKEERRRLAESGTESKVAVAWALGEAVMIGAMPGWDDEETRAQTFGMRVGPEPLRVTAALWLPDNRVYVPDDGFTEVEWGVRRTDQLAEGVPVY